MGQKKVKKKMKNKLLNYIVLNKAVLSTLFILTFSNLVLSQNFKMIKPYNFMIGVHWNIIDDDGNRFGRITDAKNTWNILDYPSSINFDYYFMKGWSAEFIASYNYYDSAKVINGSTGRTGEVFVFDLHSKYSFGYLMEQQRFDPFVYMGAGYTKREATSPQSSFTANAGGGFNLMIYAGLGIQWRTTVKVAFMPELYSTEFDYLQHHFGLIYKFPEDMVTRNNFGKPKHGWIHKKPRFRNPGGM